MKRTRAQRQAEEPLYTDPVTGAAPTQPLVLTACGHSVDASYLPNLEKRAREQKQLAGYCCPICDRVASGAVRNFALEEVLGLEVVGGPVLRQPAFELAARPLAQESEFLTVGIELRQAIERTRDRPFLLYKERSLRVLQEQILPLIKNGDGTGEAPHASRLRELPMFPTWSDFLAWMDFGDGRYRTEFRQSHGLEIVVVFARLNEEDTRKLQGGRKDLNDRNCVYEECTREEWVAEGKPDWHKAIWLEYALVVQ